MGSSKSKPFSKYLNRKHDWHAKEFTVCLIRPDSWWRSLPSLESSKRLIFFPVPFTTFAPWDYIILSQPKDNCFDYLSIYRAKMLLTCGRGCFGHDDLEWRSWRQPHPAQTWWFFWVGWLWTCCTSPWWCPVFPQRCAPVTACLAPLGKKTKQNKWQGQLLDLRHTAERLWRDLDFLTFAASDAVRQFDVRAEFAHLLYHLTDLEGQLVCRRDTKSLGGRKKTLTWHTQSKNEHCSRSRSLPESTCGRGSRGWAWPEKRQQFYLCLTVTGQSDSEVCISRNWKEIKYYLKCKNVLSKCKYMFGDVKMTGSNVSVMLNANSWTAIILHSTLFWRNTKTQRFVSFI